VPTTGFTYSSLRIFYRPHPQRDKLPTEPAAIPLLVFIHGLGGSIAQFHPLLTSLVNCADSLAIDLPGCGLSRFDPKDWKAYSMESLVYLIAHIIHEHRDKEHGQKVVLICHSMGCSLGAHLASSTSPYRSLLSENVGGMVAICPAAEPPDAKQATFGRRVLSLLPVFLFDLWRMYDRRGGVDSKSILRFTGEDADVETRRLQLRFNEQSRSAVWIRMAYGCLPDYSNGAPIGGIPGKSVWSGLEVPLFLVAGEADRVTPSNNVHKIAEFLGQEESQEPHKVAEKSGRTSSTTSVIKTEIDDLRKRGPDVLAAQANRQVPQDSVSLSSYEETFSQLLRLTRSSTHHTPLDHCQDSSRSF
jgi:pimeloyl-ACP methyl ester carboxylesterase